MDLAKGIKLLTPKQMSHGLPIALAQFKAGDTSENLLNKIRQIIYCMYQKNKKKRNTNNTPNSIKL